MSVWVGAVCVCVCVCVCAECCLSCGPWLIEATRRCRHFCSVFAHWIGCCVDYPWWRACYVPSPVAPFVYHSWSAVCCVRFIFLSGLPGRDSRNYTVLNLRLNETLSRERLDRRLVYRVTVCLDTRVVLVASGDATTDTSSLPRVRCAVSPNPRPRRPMGGGSGK